MRAIIFGICGIIFSIGAGASDVIRPNADGVIVVPANDPRFIPTGEGQVITLTPATESRMGG